MFVSSILLVLGIITLYWLHSQYHIDIAPEPSEPPKNAPLISICVPARNEARNIRRCVESLLAQDYPNFEVVVLDDRSTDGTSEILAELSQADDRLKVINGVELPSGWAGKPHALMQASAVARGEWLCFVDADTFPAQNTLTAVHSKALETEADFFTIFTHQEMETFWERAVLPLVLTALSVGFPPKKVNDPNTKIAIANGQFIFIKRSA